MQSYDLHNFKKGEVSRMLPERSLWAAVVERAFEDAKGNVMKTPPRKRENYPNWLQSRDRVIKDAFQWFKNNRKTVGGFLWVCDVLELEPGPIREKIAKLEREYIPKLKFWGNKTGMPLH